MEENDALPSQPCAEGTTAFLTEMPAPSAALSSIAVKVDPAYCYFGLVGEPTPHKQHQNQQAGLDLYVHVINLETGEPCFKKLYDNSRGLHFKHTGYSPMYLADFTEDATVYPFQFVRHTPRSTT